MKLSRQAKLAYAAGLIDGEGCISISKKVIRNGKYAGSSQSNYGLAVVVTQRDGKIVDWLYGNFGGSIYLHWKGTPTGWSHEWVLQYKNAAAFLKQILPFLVYKTPQAQIAVRFQDRMTASANKKLSEHEFQVRHKMYEEIGALKHIAEFSKHPNVQKRVSVAGVTTK